MVFAWSCPSGPSTPAFSWRPSRATAAGWLAGLGSGLFLALALASPLALTAGLWHSRAAGPASAHRVDERAMGPGILPGAVAGLAVPAFATAEVDRIREHLLGAERLLLSADVSSLGADQLAARGRMIAWLRDYRTRGIFPHHHGGPSGFAPFFVDAHGTRCAVGYLLEMSGESDLVARVAASDNNVYVAELAGDPAFRAWLDRSGLTLLEAARIQPQYGQPPGPEPDRSTDPAFRAVSIGGALLGAGAIVWNATADRTGPDWYVPSAVALGVGSIDLAMGVAGRLLDNPDKYPNGLVTMDLIVGAVTAAVGLVTTLHGRKAPTAATQGEGAPERDRSKPPRLQLSPWLPPSTGSGAGFQLRVRF